MLIQLTMQYTDEQSAIHVALNLEDRGCRTIRGGTVVTVVRPDPDPACWGPVIEVLTRYLG